MEATLENKFLEHINENIGIAYKVCNIYFQDPEERADVLQEMFYQLWKSYPSFREQSKFSTWMYTVCLNTAITYFKKNQKISHVKASQSSYDFDDDHSDDYEEQLNLLHKRIEHLSPVNKSIILLYMEGFKYDEISAITGLTKNNISVRLVRIKYELKNCKPKIV
jgi:RNA polymerase sigma-70 factor (ECF subfamily)